MDVGEVLEKIPSVERLLGLGWVICWFLAIWIYHIQFFVTGLFCLFLALLISGSFEKSKGHKGDQPPIKLIMDKSTRSLKVQKLYEGGLRWEDYEICSGSTVLPVGSIEEGDTITKCKGNVALRHVPSNRLLGGFEFD